MGGAPLGDLRLSKRLVRTTHLQAGAPTLSVPEAAEGDRGQVKGHYRFIDQPAASEVTPENILAPLRARTVRRLQGERVALCLQDGSDLNFAEHPGCVGLGLIAKNKNSEGTRGLHMHSTLAVSTAGVLLFFRFFGRAVSRLFGGQTAGFFRLCESWSRATARRNGGAGPQVFFRFFGRCLQIGWHRHGDCPLLRDWAALAADRGRQRAGRAQRLWAAVATIRTSARPGCFLLQ